VRDDGAAETAGDGLDGPFDGAFDDKADGVGPRGTTRAFAIEHGAFPGGGHPDVVAYLPERFDATPPLDVIVFLHGWNNCASNVIGSVDRACTPGGARRRSYALAAQLEATGKNAILIAPELAFDRATGDPGRLGEPGALVALLDDTLAQLAPELGAERSANDVGRVIVASHSGGYRTAAAFVRDQSLPIDELYLLDSLYGETDAFDAWIDDDRDAFASGARRFASIYTRDGGTLAESQAMAARAAAWLPPAAIHDDRSTATWTAPAYAHGALFKRTGLTHDGVPRYYVGRLILTSALASH